MRDYFDLFEGALETLRTGALAETGVYAERKKQGTENLSFVCLARDLAFDSEYKRETAAVLQTELKRMLRRFKVTKKDLVLVVGVGNEGMTADALGGRDKITMDTAKSLREDYLHQNAFHETDTYTSPKKQFRMLKLILEFDNRARAALNENVETEDIFALGVKEKIGRCKYISEENMSEFDKIEDELAAEFEALTGKR